MFERLSAEEVKRECDRVRHLLVTNPNLSVALRPYGRFPACPRVLFLPDAAVPAPLVWPQQFAPLAGASTKARKALAAPPAAAAGSVVAGPRRVKLEVCSGHGDWVTQHAANEPECDWIALEIRRDRVYHIWSKMVFANLSNLLVIGGEAHGVVRQYMGDATLDEVFINFPEPPGWAGSKLRLIDQPFLIQLHRCLKADACLTVVTDNEPYAESVAAEFAALSDRYMPWPVCAGFYFCLFIQHSHPSPVFVYTGCWHL